MTSILTNASSMSGLRALRGLGDTLATSQERMSSGLRVASGADNAAYFSISQTMKSDASMLASIQEGLTLTRNAVATARLGAETIVEIGQQMADRVAFALNDGVDVKKVQEEIDRLADQAKATVMQSTFNGVDLIDAESLPYMGWTMSPVGIASSGITTPQTVVTGVSRSGGGFATTELTFQTVNLAVMASNLDSIKLVGPGPPTWSTPPEVQFRYLVDTIDKTIEMATSLGITEKSIENQQKFLGKLHDNFEEGIGAMMDADMEEEAARLKSLQVQQQLASTALSISNAAPQQLLALFR